MHSLLSDMKNVKSKNNPNGKFEADGNGGFVESCLEHVGAQESSNFNFLIVSVSTNTVHVKMNLSLELECQTEASYVSFNTVAPNGQSSSSMSLIERAWTDVRMLTVVEQNINMTCLTAYKDSLQWIIDNQTWLQTKEPGIIRWFKERATYDPMELEVPVRVTPRKRKR